MATPDEMITAASELTKKRVKVRDREYENFTPAEIIEAAELIEAKTAPNGPFIRVGFKGRAGSVPVQTLSWTVAILDISVAICVALLVVCK